GSCATTRPSRPLSVTSREATRGTRPAAVSVSLASLRVCPERSGTSTVGIALATTIVTPVPGSTLLPAAGDWLTTVPGAFVSVSFCAIVTSKPRLPSVCCACCCVKPTTSGTEVCCGPLETTTVTSDPRATLWPAAGEVEITSPAGTVPSGCCTTRLTLKPAAVSCLIAFCWLSPTTVGTCTGAGPLETINATVESSFACAPPAGLCASTWPAGLPLAVRSTATFNPAARSSALADCTPWPTTCGTVTVPVRVSSTTPTTIAASASAASTQAHHGRRRRSSSAVGPGGEA